MSEYTGPILGEPLPIELHNTLYAVRGRIADGLAEPASLRGWLGALAEGLPVEPRAVDQGRLGDVLALRAAVREALHAEHEGRAMSSEAVAELNRASARNPGSLQLAQDGGVRTSEIRQHAPSTTDVVLGLIASSTIELVTGPRAGDLRACGAPGCALMFLKDHPRREWCSATCGNRARQARHYARTKAR
jgi:predicted RNA-binding Zn ribbon-like protein